jgi:hypothetical protein
MNEKLELVAQIAGLLDATGLKTRALELVQLAGGGNNRLWRVATPAGTVLAKQYFRHESDQRDRLGAEFAFLAHAHAIAPETCPRPLAKDDDAGIALYEFIDGSPLRPNEIGITEVLAAIDFLRAVNHEQRQAPSLHAVAEACFSIDAHLKLVGGRIDSVLTVLRTEISPDAQSIATRLDNSWRRCHDAVREASHRLGLHTSATLSDGQRIISPSDFGFHNALRRDDGRLCFIDFEYAGWDDPAKTVGDFFQQPAVPVPAELFDCFANAAAAETDDIDVALARIRLLRPVYAAKWCSIVLNVFLPVHLARRRFADPKLDEAALKRGQLDKAAKQLSALEHLIANKEATWLTSI